MIRVRILLLTALFAPALAHPAQANFITATPANYTSYLGSLVAGDTLFLPAGTYADNLPLIGRNGTAAEPIVILGDPNLYTTVFTAEACCNTVSISTSSYVVIKNLKLDGLGLAVDAVKGEGTTGNWAHHITLEYLHIVNYGADQQLVGISTKCHAWDWVIRKNIIDGAGTGMYLGNSNGDRPFVNGLIENNLIVNTVGYNLQIKHQADTVRDNFAGTNVNGRTIVRYNVFSKESNGSTGGNARPNVLFGAFPSTGMGSTDRYEVYGNFFYQNPTEALIQITGNTMLYNNVFVNHADPAGFRAVVVTSQNGFQPRDISVFHNTVWAANSSGGIGLYSPNTGYQQYCHGNAVFAPSPIYNFTNSVDNVTDTYANASAYVLSATTALGTLDLYPQSGQLTGTTTPNTLFQNYTDWNHDFNGDMYDWTYRGAYSGCCTNNGWQLQLDTMPTPAGGPTGIGPTAGEHPDELLLYPNPAPSSITCLLKGRMISAIEIRNTLGELVLAERAGGTMVTVDVAHLPAGPYCILVKDHEQGIVSRRFLKF